MQQIVESGTPPPGGEVSFSPRKVPFNATMLQRLHVPAGFQVTVFAGGVSDARMLALGPRDTVYVSQPGLGQISALTGGNRPGGVATPRVVVTGIDGVHGLAVHGDKLYFAAPTRLYVADLRPDGSVGPPRVLVDNLPPGGRHPNRTLGFGPDGLLYLSIGSDCNDCAESDPAYATIQQLHADGSGRHTYARGLRNTEAFAWHPVTHALWGMDQGVDNRGPDLPPEELNHIMEGRDYGWPWCYGDRQVDALTPGNPPGMSKAQYCRTTEPMVLGYQAHSSPISLVFYTGHLFPAAYRNDAFLTLRGSWNRKPAVGYKVVRIHFDTSGHPTGFSDFLTGFLIDDGKAQFGRPTGLAILRDGSLLISEDNNGVIYRVTYHGAR